MPIQEKAAAAKPPVCGIIMPISDCDGLGHAHWTDVLSIVRIAAKMAGFEARLVSDTFESNLIHKEILSNVYNDDIVIFDVSGRNPNVFFELGIRMATQKPTVIIKDDKTLYPFDTSPNRYIEYPRDLRHPGMEKFKTDLVSSLEKTSAQEASSSFIGQLGPFQIPKIESQEASIGDVVLQKINQLERRMEAQRNHRLSDERHYHVIPDTISRPFVFESSIHKGCRIVAVIEGDSALRLESYGYPRDMVENGLLEYKRNSKYGNLLQRFGIEEFGSSKFVVDLKLSRKINKIELELIFSAIDDAIPF
jgi:hypothetical protein